MKDYLIKIIKSKPAYERYLPDGIKHDNLSKDFLFSVSINITFQLIAHVEPETYSGLYDLYKKKAATNGNKKWNNYTININEEMLRQVTAYEPSKK